MKNRLCGGDEGHGCEGMENWLYGGDEGLGCEGMENWLCGGDEGLGGERMNWPCRGDKHNNRQNATSKRLKDMSNCAIEYYCVL